MGGKSITPRQTTNGIAGTVTKTTVTQQISRNSCNIHVTPAPNTAIGTVDYYYDAAKASVTVSWLSRHFDFLNRHKSCSHGVPDYYLDYGNKYIRRFTDELYPKLSNEGKKWLIEARRFLQLYMEDGFKQNLNSLEVVTQSSVHPKTIATTKTPKTESLELDNDRFRSFAYGTHPAAYIDGGLYNLTLGDLWEVGWTPDFLDLFSGDGLAQVKDILAYLIEAKTLAAQEAAIRKLEEKGLEITERIIQQGKKAVTDEIKRQLDDLFRLPRIPRIF